MCTSNAPARHVAGVENRRQRGRVKMHFWQVRQRLDAGRRTDGPNLVVHELKLADLEGNLVAV